MKVFAVLAAGLGWLNLVLVALWIGATALLLNRSQAHLEAWPSDFGVFWQVSRLTLSGDVLRAFDTAAMAPVWQLPSTVSYAWEPLWLYPPTWTAMVAPVGLMPFSIAFAVFTAVTLVFFALSLRGAAAVLPGGIMLVMASPTLWASATIGNNAVLTAAIAVAALSALAAGRERRSGVAMALMAIKPQLGVVLALAAFAARARGTVATAAAGSLAFLCVATLICGFAYWPAFVEAFSAHDSGVRGDGGYQQAVAVYGYMDLSITPYAYARAMGLGDMPALALHLATALTGGALAAMGWHRIAQARREGTAPGDGLVPSTIALSLILIPLIPHRALPYEAMFLLAAVPFLWAAGAAAHWPGRVALVIAWFGVPRPVFDMAGIPVAGTMMPAILLLLAYAAWQVWRRRAVAPRPTAVTA
ncbi:MAG: glycosyltransferase family 87 protein [Pseudomonadota bacterium]